jgi:hypothetical protein
MATSRYTFVNVINGERISTTDISSRIYFAAQNQEIRQDTIRLKQSQRIDHLAAQSYGDGSLWWIIAAASGIGWNLQCPAGTVLIVPKDLNQIYSLLR